MDGGLKIGEAARRVGMGIKAIRYYERGGLIPPAKRSEAVSSNGYRLFTESDLRRLEFIKRAKLLDLSLSQIKELMDAALDACCTSARPALKSMIETKLPEIDDRIAMLRKLRADMTKISKSIADNPAGDTEECDCPSTSDLNFCVFDERVQAT